MTPPPDRARPTSERGRGTGPTGLSAQGVDAILGWGITNLRDLPWRHTRDPWAVLVAEVMLQQTQVARVLDRWPRFLRRFPNPQACAAAPLRDVLAEWQGLGYPRRARYLRETAAAVSIAGRFPDSLTELQNLPGIGPYTARAVLIFAFERDEAVVDTNIARVYARMAGRRLTAGAVQRAADRAVPTGMGWEWNQILMDLGARVCRARVPDCDACPVRAMCAWRGNPAEPDPAVGSGGVSGPQARFEGSDRQARGRLMKALAAGPIEIVSAPSVMERSEVVARRLIADLVAERLCAAVGDRLVLGDGTDQAPNHVDGVHVDGEAVIASTISSNAASA